MLSQKGQQPVDQILTDSNPVRNQEEVYFPSEPSDQLQNQMKSSDIL